MNDPHPMTVRSDDPPYGCKDRQPSSGYWHLQRNYAPDGSFSMVCRFIKHTMSTDCRYDKRREDRRCTTCMHRDV